MKTLLTYTARTLSRRKMLGRASTVAFGLLAGAAVGAAPNAIAASGCSGPGGSGSCGCSCLGSKCGRCGSVSCNSVKYCNGYTCWTNDEGRTCCDCQCGAYGQWWFCYCEG